MFGNDLYEDDQRGIIPRAAADIFKNWQMDSEVEEIAVQCSMLEIYKENLRDLLADEVGELKLKESPNRGVYVEGLSVEPISCEEELLYWIEEGEGRRVWAETRHNSVSSRSHSIFMLDVTQKLSNNTEKRGILNLVDLAGSEKVGKTGAQGTLFEEGTKINLSLSALGNVIHALTGGLDHIPYRDSKLTRLLQESLGGNYKTTLIVTCSGHSSQLQETLSTLKFAQRAKKLKNRVQVNIKHSPDQMMKLIEQLREELKEKNLAIQKMLENYDLPGASELLKKSGFKIGGKHTGGPGNAELRKLSYDKMKKSSGGQSTDEIPSTLLSRTNSPDSETYSMNLIELQSENNRLKQKLKDLTAQVEKLSQEKTELETKLKKSEIELLEEKKATLSAEQKANESEHYIIQHKVKKDKLRLQSEAENSQIKVLQHQIKALTEALEDSENECLKLLKEKKDKFEGDIVELCKLNIVDYVNKDTLQTAVRIV